MTKDQTAKWKFIGSVPFFMCLVVLIILYAFAASELMRLWSFTDESLHRKVAGTIIFKKREQDDYTLFHVNYKIDSIEYVMNLNSTMQYYDYADFEIGDSVEVVYNIQKPSEAIITRHYEHFYIIPISLFILTLIFLIPIFYNNGDQDTETPTS